MKLQQEYPEALIYIRGLSASSEVLEETRKQEWIFSTTQGRQSLFMTKQFSLATGGTDFQIEG